MTNIIHAIHIFIFLALSIFPQDIRKDKKENNIKLIFAKNSFHNIKTEDAIATAQILANHIKKYKKLKNDFIVNLANDDKEISEMCKDDFDLVLLTTEQYLRLKKTLPLEPFTTNYTNGTYGFIYHLIVNKSDSINDIKQLSGESIYIQAHSKDQASSLWLNKLLKDVSPLSADKFFKKINIDSKASNVLLPVFFKKAKACIVTNSSLKLLMELNPNIANQVKILYTSEPIILGFTCLNANKKNDENYRILKEVLPTLHENEYGKQFLDLFKAEKLILFKEEYLKGYYNLIK
jgi:ABC-type phosphate/phosphonate transport system substrate-binding protein